MATDSLSYIPPSAPWKGDFIYWIYQAFRSYRERNEELTKKIKFKMTVKEQLTLVLKASRKLNLVSVDRINQILLDVAAAAIENTDFILQIV